MKGAELSKALRLDINHALYRKDGKWFHHLKDFPRALFDNEGYIIIKSKEKYQTQPSF